jgi:hypothetical protein
MRKGAPQYFGDFLIKISKILRGPFSIFFKIKYFF